MKANKINITISAFTLLLLLLVLFLIWPLYTEIKNNSNSLISAKNNIVTLKAQVNETNKFEKGYEKYKNAFEKIDQLFVDSKNPVDFIKFLEETAFDSGVTLKISLPSSYSGLKQFAIFQLYSTGGFSNIFDFTKKIENGPYLVEIFNLSIRNSELVSKETTIKIPENYLKREVDATFNIKVFTK